MTDIPTPIDSVESNVYGTHRKLRFGSIFSGIGCLDLGLKRSGMVCKWQIENDYDCNRVLSANWPFIRRHQNVKDLDFSILEYIDLLVGGDPCQTRSDGWHIHGSHTSEDLWPYFRTAVQVLRPRWVLREHVVSPHTEECWSDLVELGYFPVILEINGSKITGQSRFREYLCGVSRKCGICPGSVFSEQSGMERHTESSKGTGPIAACLTTRAYRFDASDNYILESGNSGRNGGRILSPREREALQGLPKDYTSGLPNERRYKVIGNGAITYAAQWIGEKIIAYEASLRSLMGIYPW